MYTSRDRTGLGFQQSTPGYYSPPARCYSACRSPSPSACRTTCNHICGCPVSIPHCARKTVRFDRRSPHLGRSRSVSRAGFHGTYLDSDGGCVYRHGSPTFSREKAVASDAKMMEYANLNVLLRRLSILQLEMKGLLNGKSLRERVQMIGQKLDDDNHLASPKENLGKDVWLVENNYANNLHSKCHHQEQNCPVETYKWQHPHCPKQEEHPSFCRKDESGPARERETQDQHVAGQKKGNGSEESVDPDWKERKQIVHLWREYNCDLHLRRIIDGSRKEAAWRILEKVVHQRLTYYMLQYIAAVAKGLMGDEKTHYLSFFKREGPFRNKPLNEGTYCELLSFVGKQASPAKDVIKALEVSEEGLEEEGGRGGYDPNAMGDIRAQMRVFLSVAGATSSPLPSNSAAVSQAEDDEDLFTPEFLQDLIQAADQGKLGALQNAHKLIKLACFLALKNLDSSTWD